MTEALTEAMTPAPGGSRPPAPEAPPGEPAPGSLPPVAPGSLPEAVPSGRSAVVLGGLPAVAPGSLPAVVLGGVSKVFGRGPNAVLALDRVSLDVAPGEFVCLVGASGCGKSTLLSLVAGLDRPSAGEITVDGGTHPDQPGGRAAAPALMFQEPALFPWLTVSANVELPLRLRGMGRAERRRRAAELLASVHLTEFAHKRPHQLSGGMRQRVALARTLALDAPVLLMDEPFGALDAMTRDLLHDELERIWIERRLTVLFVTHNVREAARLADRIVLLSSRPGRVIWEHRVDIARPRRIDSPEVSGLAARTTERLREEVARHGR